MTNIIRRGDVYYADLGSTVGAEQGGLRPVLVVQNDIGNKYSPTVIILPMTTQISKRSLPTHYKIKNYENGLKKDSVVLCEQIRTVDKTRLKEYLFTLDEYMMSGVNKAMEISVGLMTNHVVNRFAAC